MEFNLKEILTATMILFAVIDIIGNIPIIISLRKKNGHVHSEKASIITAVVLIIFLFLGERILNLIGQIFPLNIPFDINADTVCNV